MVTLLQEQIEAVKSCTDFESVSALVRKFNIRHLSPQNYVALERKINQVIDVPDIKFAFLSNFTLDTLPTYAGVLAAVEGIRFGSYVGAFNQYFQEVLNEQSGLYHYDPDIIFLALSMHDLEPEVVHSFSGMSRDEKSKRFKKTFDHIANWLSLVTEKFTSTVIVCNFNLPGFNQKGVADVNDSYSEMRFYYELNLKLEDLLRGNQRTHLFDIAQLSARYGLERVVDPKMYYLAKMYWSEQFLSVVSEELVRYVIAVQGRTKKCIVLDLDNTIWGGVAGEEGPLGVKIGLGDPVSEAYLDFQFEIKALKERGILLALCSKNNKEDALEVFRKRPEMPLKISDFTAMEINWDHKHINLMKIAETLNIGIDSLVFVDDNPAECSLIQQMLPTVKSVLLPADHEQISTTIRRLASFEKMEILKDDKKKTEQYHQDHQRDILKNSVNDLERYLHSLKTEIRIIRAEEKDISRMHQLFLKTNQFNITTVRYSRGRIEEFLHDSIYDLWYVTSQDCYGFMGIIGLYLLQKVYGDMHIDSFILSCRAMGRDIEVAIMNHIKQQYLTHKNGGYLTGRYDPTDKNRPIAEFFDKQGFELIGESAEGSKSYRLSRDNLSLLDCPWIKVLN